MLGLIVSLLVIFVPVLLYQFVMVKIGRYLTKSHRNWTYIMAIYLWGVFMITGVGSIWDIMAKGGLMASLQQANFCWIPFQDGMLLTALLNILLFFPLGFLLPHIWQNCRMPLKTVLIGYFYSVLIELAQIPTNRAVDVEDVIMNTLGTFLGYVFWKAFGNYFFQGRVSHRLLPLSRKEPLVYLGMALFCQFFLYNWRWFV